VESLEARTLDLSNSNPKGHAKLDVSMLEKWPRITYLFTVQWEKIANCWASEGIQTSKSQPTLLT
jgi:hypothetical protein